MDSRKVIKFGNSSYVVTLPFEWVKKHSLDKGQNVNIVENHESLILSLDKEKEPRIANIELDDKPLKLLNREIISFYLKNYDYIRLNGKNAIDKLEEVKAIKEKLSSIEIIEISQDLIVLEDLTSVRELNVNKLINEIIEMEKIIFDELIKNKDENRHFFISSLDSNINKLSFLGYKAINYNFEVLDSKEIKQCIHLWRIISSLEQTGDIMKRIARYLKEKKNKEESHHVGMVLESLKEYFEFTTSLLSSELNLNNNMKLCHDKKQSLLREFENLREVFKADLTLYLVITQLFKDLLGEIDRVIISIIDLKNDQ